MDPYRFDETPEQKAAREKEYLAEPELKPCVASAVYEIQRLEAENKELRKQVYFADQGKGGAQITWKAHALAMQEQALSLTKVRQIQYNTVMHLIKHMPDIPSSTTDAIKRWLHEWAVARKEGRKHG